MEVLSALNVWIMYVAVFLTQLPSASTLALSVNDAVENTFFFILYVPKCIDSQEKLTNTFTVPVVYIKLISLRI